MILVVCWCAGVLSSMATAAELINRPRTLMYYRCFQSPTPTSKC